MFLLLERLRFWVWLAQLVVVDDAPNLVICIGNWPLQFRESLQERRLQTASFFFFQRLLRAPRVMCAGKRAPGIIKGKLVIFPATNR